MLSVSDRTGLLWIMAAKIEQQRCLWFRQNQGKLRADKYSAVQAASQGASASQELSGRALGRRVVLPAKYVGGPRFMTQLYFDGMAIVRKYGKADLFVTFTACAVCFFIFLAFFFVMRWVVLYTSKKTGCVVEPSMAGSDGVPAAGAAAK